MSYTPPVPGSINFDFAEPAASITLPVIDGSLSVTLDGVSLVSTGELAISGSASLTLGGFYFSYPPQEEQLGQSLSMFFLSGEIKNKRKETFVLKSIVPQLIPRFVFEEYPRFGNFIERWCDFVERFYDPDGTKNPGPYFVLRNFLPLVDIDTTLAEFIRFHKAAYGSDLPDISVADAVHVLKRVRQFYQSKGTVKSFEFFFRFVFDSFLRVELPKTQMLRASAGTWSRPYLLRLRKISGGDLLDATEQAAILDYSITGDTSGATGFIGFPVQAALSGEGPTLYYMVPIKDQQGFFQLGESVTLEFEGVESRFYIDGTSGIQQPEGSWLTTDGFLSSDMRLQDSYFWQDFSYVAVSSEGLGEVLNPVLKNLHPAGLKLFAKVTSSSVEPIQVWPIDYDFSVRWLTIIYLFNRIPYIGEIDPEWEVDEPDIDHLRTTLIMSDRFQAFYDGSLFTDRKETIEWSHWETLDDMDFVLSALSESTRQETLSFTSLGGLKLPVEADLSSNTAFSEVLVQSKGGGTCSFDLGSVSLSVFEGSTIDSMRWLASTELAEHTDVFSPTSAELLSSSFLRVSARSGSATGGHALFKDGVLVPTSLYTRGSSGGYASLTISLPDEDFPTLPVYEYLSSPELSRFDFTVTATRQVSVPQALDIKNTLVFANGRNLVGGVGFFVQNGMIQFSKVITGTVTVLCSQNLTTVLRRKEATLGVIEFNTGDSNRSHFGLLPDRMVIT